MIDGALPYLRCPVCEQHLSRHDRTLRCPAGHGFDLARQGYANLAAGRAPHPGDTAEMIADRDAFLSAGHYDFIADALAALATPDGPTRPVTPDGLTRPAAPDGDQPTRPPTPDGPTRALTPHGGQPTPDGGQPTPDHGQPTRPPAPGGDRLIVDAGTGTGYYLARVLATAPGATGLGIDVSKAALRRAARAHPRAAAVLADLWRPLPIRDGTASVLLDVFAPRNGPEFHRVLRHDGVLLVVTPAPDHLAELIEAHGLIHVDPDKAARVADSLGDRFAAAGRRVLRRTLQLTGPEARTLIGMTPSAHHLPAAARPAGPCAVTAAVTVTAYRKR